MDVKSVAVVTGASQGIGKATALRPARDLAAVLLVARDKENLEAAAKEVRSAGAETETLAADPREPQAAETVVKTVLDRFGRIDALLNIAGAELKLHGVRRLTMRAWDALKKTNGSVVFISKSMGFDFKPAFAAVAVINAAINALAKSFAEQGVKDGVQVNSVSPGAVMTGRRRAFFEKWAPTHNMTVEEAMSRFPQQAGSTRFGKAEGSPSAISPARTVSTRA
jgi:3-oxoacyl-[acyl-carrier protein] reductase